MKVVSGVTYKTFSASATESAKPTYRDVDLSSLPLSSYYDYDDINSVFRTLRKDAQDGKLDQYAVTVAMDVAYIENDNYGGHAMQIVDIKGDYVYIIDPNDETYTPYQMSIKDFKRCYRDVTYNKM